MKAVREQLTYSGISPNEQWELVDADWQEVETQVTITQD